MISPGPPLSLVTLKDQGLQATKDVLWTEEEEPAQKDVQHTGNNATYAVFAVINLKRERAKKISDKNCWQSLEGFYANEDFLRGFTSLFYAESEEEKSREWKKG